MCCTCPNIAQYTLSFIVNCNYDYCKIADAYTILSKAQGSSSNSSSSNSIIKQGGDFRRGGGAKREYLHNIYMDKKSDNW